MEYILQLLFLRSSVHREHETAEHEFWVTDGIFLETLRMFYVFSVFIYCLRLQPVDHIVAMIIVCWNV